MVAHTIDPICRERQARTRQRLAQRSKCYQILEMQEELKKDMEGANPMQKAALVGAWDKLEERLRILKGKPLPGSLVHEKLVRGRRKLSGISSFISSMGASTGALSAVCTLPSEDLGAESPTIEPSSPQQSAS